LSRQSQATRDLAPPPPPPAHFASCKIPLSSVTGSRFCFITFLRLCASRTFALTSGPASAPLATPGL
jgi:hypothetical protein